MSFQESELQLHRQKIELTFGGTVYQFQLGQDTCIVWQWKERLYKNCKEIHTYRFLRKTESKQLINKPKKCFSNEIKPFYSSSPFSVLFMSLVHPKYHRCLWIPSQVQTDHLTVFPSHIIAIKKHKRRDCIPSIKAKPS